MNSNDPAFPEEVTIYDNPQSGLSPMPPHKELRPGLTKREYFAAMAMQGILSHIVDQKFYFYDVIAIEAGRFADALIAELSKDSK